MRVRWSLRVIWGTVTAMITITHLITRAVPQSCWKGCRLTLSCPRAAPEGSSEIREDKRSHSPSGVRDERSWMKWAVWRGLSTGRCFRLLFEPSYSLKLMIKHQDSVWLLVCRTCAGPSSVTSVLLLGLERKTFLDNLLWMNGSFCINIDTLTPGFSRFICKSVCFLKIILFICAAVTLFLH